MCLKNKIVAAALCALIAGIGVFGISGDGVHAQTNTGTTATNLMTIGQLQAMVQSLMQQIQQLVQLIAQLKPLETCGNGICRFGETAASCPKDCAADTTCAKEGDRFNIDSRQCCSGLTKKQLGYDCMGTACNNAPMNYICVNPNACVNEGVVINLGGSCCSNLKAINHCTGSSCSFTKQICTKCGDGICGLGETNQNCSVDCDYTELTCAQACMQQGFLKSSSYCNKWTLLPGQSMSATCASNEFGVGWTIDCNANGAAQYAGMNCCCNKQVAPECGNKTCETGETVSNCPNDCPLKVGGDCSYKAYMGTCTIKSGNGYTFTTTEVVDISQTFLTSPQQINPYSGSLNGVIGTLPNNLTVGSTFSCVLNVINNGTCTPFFMQPAYTI